MSLCTVSGYLKDIQGNALKGYLLTLRHIYSPAHVGADTLIVGERQTVRTDASGYLTFTVYQKSKIRIEVPGRMLDYIRTSTIPAASTADLIDILYPYVVSVAFDSGDTAVSLAEGGSKSYQLTATLSDGEELNVTSAITLSSNVPSIVSASGSTVTAESSGSATISISEVDTDSLSLYKEPSGELIARLDMPSITFTNTSTVTVT